MPTSSMTRRTMRMSGPRFTTLIFGCLPASHSPGFFCTPTMVKQLHGTTYTKKQQEMIAVSNRQDALDIMLARRGKVRYVNTCDGWHIKDLMPGHGESSKRAWDEAFDLWVYIRDELRRNGVPAKLIFQTGEIEEFKRTAYDADDVEKFRYMSGSLTWLPLTNFDHNLNYV